MARASGARRRVGRLPAVRLECDYVDHVKGLRARHRVTFRTCIAPGGFRPPGCPRQAGHSCAPHPAPPPSRHPSRPLFAAERALTRLQRHLTTFKGRDVRFGLTRPDRGFTPLHTPRPGLLAKTGPGSYAACIVSRRSGDGENAIHPSTPRQEGTEDALARDNGRLLPAHPLPSPCGCQEGNVVRDRPRDYYLCGFPLPAFAGTGSGK